MRHQLDLEDADIEYLQKCYGKEAIERFLTIDIDRDENLDAKMDEITKVAIAMELVSESPRGTKYWLNPDKRIAAYSELMRQQYEPVPWILSEEDFNEGMELLLGRKLEEWELLYRERFQLIEKAIVAYNKLFPRTSS